MRESSGDRLLAFFYRIYPASIYTRAARLASRIDGRVYCDIGGGSGNLYRALIALGNIEAYYVLVDPDIVLLDMAPRGIEIDVVQGVAESLPLRRRACSVSVFFDSLHHFSRPCRALLEAQRTGRCLLVEDIDKSKTAGRLIAVIERGLGYPGFFFEHSRLKKIVEKLGFRIVFSSASRVTPVYTIIACKGKSRED